jgi:uncharacterized protein YbjT (DUF2867 family)
MKILLTGATGYIGKRLIPVLADQGHEIICCVRNKSRLYVSSRHQKSVMVIEMDFLQPATLDVIPDDIDAAYYLIHSMASGVTSFEVLEAESARNFRERINKTKVQQVIYLSGIVNEEKLSKHLQSRHQVEEILSAGDFNLTTLRAGIIVGSGSASFEIIRDLVEKLPVMITPRWLNTKSQPIAIRDVIMFLSRCLFQEETYGKSFDIGGPDILTYKEMLLQYAEVRNLHRKIFIVPVMTPRLSSYWLYFVTATSYPLAVNLVNSMKVEVICKPNNLNDMLGIHPITYKEAIRNAFKRIEHSEIISSWKDAMASGVMNADLSEFVEVPSHGCYKDHRTITVGDSDKTLDKIWAIGGDTGWYYANWLWSVRGIMDKLAGGVGLRRGRTSPEKLNTGDALDFWRVLLADKSQKRLLLFAEMKLPGEAWLEFKIDKKNTLHQTATFRPKGLWGRMYWYTVLPLHYIIFKGMIRSLAS